MGLRWGAALLLAATRNPIVPGWYADPEIRRFDGRYWIYPTLSQAPADAPAPRLSAAQASVRARTAIGPCS